MNAQTDPTGWTPKFVSRPNEQGDAVLAIKAQWDQGEDLLYFTADGGLHQWFRRGAPLFSRRAECVKYISSKGWIHG